jgi:hypothetical protein
MNKLKTWAKEFALTLIEVLIWEHRSNGKAA